MRCQRDDSETEAPLPLRADAAAKAVPPPRVKVAIVADAVPLGVVTVADRD